MRVDFDPTKNERNIKERQLSFERVAEVDFNTALVFPDTRKAYGETRYIALCYLDRRLHVLCLTAYPYTQVMLHKLNAYVPLLGRSLGASRSPARGS